MSGYHLATPETTKKARAAGRGRVMDEREQDIQSYHDEQIGYRERCTDLERQLADAVESNRMASARIEELDSLLTEEHALRVEMEAAAEAAQGTLARRLADSEAARSQSEAAAGVMRRALGSWDIWRGEKEIEWYQVRYRFEKARRLTELALSTDTGRLAAEVLRAAVAHVRAQTKAEILHTSVALIDAVARYEKEMRHE
jgi:hypothetical protein